MATKEAASPYKAGDIVWGFRAGYSPTFGSAVVAKATANQVKINDRHEAFEYRMVVPLSDVFPTRAAAVEALIIALDHEAEQLMKKLRDKQSQRARFFDELAKELP